MAGTTATRRHVNGTKADAAAVKQEAGAIDGVSVVDYAALKRKHSPVKVDKHIGPDEWANMGLLVLLYAMQGIPLGLTMGAL
jgi:hypothetical protein